MNILIAGGSGLIGRALTGRLLDEGHHVFILTRNVQPVNKGQSMRDGLERISWDAQTTNGWEKIVGSVNAVINLSGANIGEKRWNSQRKLVLRSSRVLPGQALLAAIQRAENRPGVFLQIAGVGYYGVHGDELLDELSPVGSDYLASIAKDWENSTIPIRELGVRHVVMRTGVVLTRDGGVLSPFLLQHRLFAGGPLGSGRQGISWIHIQDLINCFIFFLNNQETSGIFNVTSPQPVTNSEFGKTLGKVMKRPYWAPVPAFMLRLVLGEMSTLVLDGQKVLPKRLLEKGFQFRFPDLYSALTDLLKK